MKFEEFNKKYRKGKKDKVWKLCREGLTIMRESYDLAHDIRHVENILGYLDKILSGRKKLKVDFDVLILSVCWHDCWKASSEHGGIFNLFYRQLVEGFAAANLFKKRAKRYLLPPQILNAVYYSIRKHSQFQILPIRTTEAKLLDDADFIDAANFQRLEDTKLGQILLSRNINIRLIIWYYNRSKHNLNFEFNTAYYNSIKEEFIQYLHGKLRVS